MAMKLTTPMRRRPQLPQVLCALLVTYVLSRGWILAATVPPWQGPDEPGHAEYALILADRHQRPAGPDPVIERAVLASMDRHHFYEWVFVPAPTNRPAEFADVARLGGDPTQLDSETPVGYAPFALAALATGWRPIEVRLLWMRMVAVLLAGLTVSAAMWAAAGLFGDSMGIRVQAATHGKLASEGYPRLWPILAAGILIAASPMLAFAGSVVNNDLPAAFLAAVWWCWLFQLLVTDRMTARRLAALAALALLAVLAKRTALYLLPITGLVLVSSVWTLRSQTSAESEARWNGPLRHRVRPITGRTLRRTAAVGLAVVAIILVLWTWPQGDQAAGWVREGRTWGAQRVRAAAHSGEWGLRVVDDSPRWWQYLEQTVSLDPGRDGPEVLATAWLRRAAAGPDLVRAQLVVNDDRGSWLGQTVTLGPAWTLVTVRGRLAPTARWVRLAVVPGDGMAAGVGALDADDLALNVDGVTRLVNGGAEAPGRWGAGIGGMLSRYLEVDRLRRAVPGGLVRPLASLRLAGSGLAFMFRTFWGGFGWATIWPGRVVYGLAALLTGWAMLATGIALIYPGGLTDDPAAARALHWCALASVAALAIALVGGLAGVPAGQWPQGRYLVAALVPLWLPAVALAGRTGGRVGLGALIVIAMAIEWGAIWATLFATFARGHP